VTLSIINFRYEAFIICMFSQYVGYVVNLII